MNGDPCSGKPNLANEIMNGARRPETDLIINGIFGGSNRNLIKFFLQHKLPFPAKVNI